MILIIDTNKRRAESISDIFYYMGILSHAATPNEAFAEISSVYKAVLVSDPATFPDIKDFKERLSSYASVPMYSISENPNDKSYKDLFRTCFHENIYSSVLAVNIANDLKSQNLPSIGAYRLSGIDASCDSVRATALGHALPFTKTELMILRYLISSYSLPQVPKNILKYAFKPGKRPDISGIRTHISVMNKKFRQILNRNLIISIPDQGYIIATPEILNQLNKAEAQ